MSHEPELYHMINPNPMSRRGNVQDGGFQKNQDNLEVCRHHHPYHPHHTFTVYAHVVRTWLYHLIDQNYTNIPASIILSSFSNHQILGQLTEQPLQGPQASSHLLGTCPGSREVRSDLAKPAERRATSASSVGVGHCLPPSPLTMRISRSKVLGGWCSDAANSKQI